MVRKKVSDRHFGIGSDGLILILPSKKADVRMQMFNADGSEGEMCGNGIRCVAKYAYDHGLAKKTDMDVETKAGIKQLSLKLKDGKVNSVRVNMGEPKHEQGKSLIIDGRKFDYTYVSMGNPHAVIFVDEITDELVLKFGPKIEVHKNFPKKTNVEFAKVNDKKNVEMRVWERGSGETLACGTGACATAVASALAGKTGKKVNVKLLGGTLEIDWDKDVFMTGPATEVFSGEIEI